MHDSYVTLHRAPDRHSHFAVGATQPPKFDPITKSWIVMEPGTCERLLASPYVRLPHYSQNDAALHNRFGIDYSNLLFAYSHIPLCLQDAAHRDARRRMAEYLSGRKALVEAHIVTTVKSHLRILGQEGEVELMREVLNPFVFSVIGSLIDLDPAGPAECHLATKIFDTSLGPRKRQRMNEELGRLREMICAKLGPDASEEAIGLRIAFVILGRDSLIGTLGASLHNVLAANSGKRLDQMRYPGVPPETGVPFTERIVVEPFVDHQTEFQAGDRLRIYLQSFAHSGSARETQRIFGIGSHACLGKSVSLNMWRAITSYLAGIPLHADVISHALCTDDYTFLCPEHLTVRLRA
jgi:hypothetical protein